MAGKKPPGQANTAAKQAEREDRRREVARHLLAGRSVREIARLLKIAVGTASDDAKRVREEWRKEYALTVNEWATQETARYDVALAAVWAGVEKGHLENVDRFLKLSVARRELLGLDAPKRAEAKVEVTQSVSPEDLDSKLSRLVAGMAASGGPGSTDAR